MISFFPGGTVADLPGGEGWALERLHVSTHNGTHLDAPYHFHSTIDGGKRAITIDEVPLEWCFAPGVKLDFSRGTEGHRMAAEPGPGNRVRPHGLDEFDIGIGAERQRLGARPDCHMLRSDAQHGRAGLHRPIFPAIAVERDPDATCLERAVIADLAIEEVHRRAADEAGDEEIDRLVVDRVRRIELLDDAVAHDRDPVGQRHGLDLVVCHVDHRVLEALMQALDLDAQVRPQLRIEVR